MTFDANGNLDSISDSSGVTTFTWNARNQLSGITGPTPAAFLYDGLGRRVRKAIGPTTTEFLYDGFDVVQELAATGTTNYLRSLSIDEALGRGSEFYLADALGSTVALADPSATLATQFTYAPFGQTATTGTASTNPVAFTGRENDGTGLYYYRARQYSPSLHRFLTEDPIGLLGGVNLYRYVLDNPISFTDPLGLDVTVTLYPGAAGFGHIGVGVNTSETVGHYPLEDSIAVVMGEDVPGIVQRDRRQPIQSITIRTSPIQDEMMQRVISEALGQPRTYSLYSRNCSLFVEEVLRTGGLQVPNTIRPRELMRQLQQTYGERRGVPGRGQVR
jgi:RHS repeat-associated protein